MYEHTLGCASISLHVRRFGASTNIWVIDTHVLWGQCTDNVLLTLGVRTSNPVRGQCTDIIIAQLPHLDARALFWNLVGGYVSASHTWLQTARSESGGGAFGKYVNMLLHPSMECPLAVVLFLDPFVADNSTQLYSPFYYAPVWPGQTYFPKFLCVFSTLFLFTLGVLPMMLLQRIPHLPASKSQQVSSLSRTCFPACGSGACPAQWRRPRPYPRWHLREEARFPKSRRDLRGGVALPRGSLELRSGLRLRSDLLRRMRRMRRMRRKRRKSRERRSGTARRLNGSPARLRLLGSPLRVPSRFCTRAGVSWTARLLTRRSTLGRSTTTTSCTA